MPPADTTTTTDFATTLDVMTSTSLTSSIVEPPSTTTSTESSTTTAIVTPPPPPTLNPPIESTATIETSTTLDTTTAAPPPTTIPDSPITTSLASITDVPTTTLTPTPSSTSTCILAPTQAIINPSFEQDLDGSGTYTTPWLFSGNGNVQSNTNNAYQSYDGTHFGVLYGRSTTTASLSQTLTDLQPGATYTLSYFYNVEAASPQAICKLTTTIGGTVVDTITSPTVRTGRYLNRSVSYSTSAGQTDATLTFMLVCPRFLQLTAQSNYALDAITLTGVDLQSCPS
ncbi:hypothetical protein MMC25_001932 [Agyrium rufum]|nr:hypothetical protein [Agyrium rufum]